MLEEDMRKKIYRSMIRIKKEPRSWNSQGSNLSELSKYNSILSYSINLYKTLQNHFCTFCMQIYDNKKLLLIITILFQLLLSYHLHYFIYDKQLNIKLSGFF